MGTRLSEETHLKPKPVIDLGAFEHREFWQPSDTLREKNLLESLWSSGKAPWKTW